MQQSGANGLACDASPLMSPADFLGRVVVPRIRQQSRIVAAEPLAALTRVEQQKLAAGYAPMIQQGLLRGVRAESGRVRVQHAIGGQPVEEWISATIAMPSANRAALMNGGVAMTASNFSVMAYRVIGTWAPRGQLEQKSKLFATMLASLRGNPQYEAAVGQWLANMGRIQQQGAIDRHRIWRDAQAYISTIRGVETYIDPRSNERVELVGGYVGAWSNGKGEYILSDSPNFNPATEFKEDWRPMERPRR